MHYWVFHEEMLAKALAAFEAERQRSGASEQQAKDDTTTISQFLCGPAGLPLRGDVKP